MLNLNLNILGASNRPIVPIQPAPAPTTTTTTSTTSTTTTTTAGKYIPTTGLIQYLDATLTASYDGSGTTWFDLSGGGNNVSASFGSTFPTFATNQFNFNGTSDVLGTFLTGSITDFSAFAWVRLGTLTPAGSSDAEGIYGLSTNVNLANTSFDSLVFTETVQSKWEVATENNNRDVLSPDAETSLDYLFMGITSTAGSVKLWRNAVVLNSGVTSPITYTQPLLPIGQRYRSTTNGWQSNGYLTGSVSMCLLYNRVLTDTEITNLYTQGR